MSVSKKDSWRMFDTITNKYDFLNHFLSFGFDFLWRKSLAKEISKSKNISILDVCTGSGDQLFSIDKFAGDSTCSITGIDMSENMLSLARSKLKKKKYKSNIDFKTGNAEEIPFGDDLFDYVSVSFGIRNVEHTVKALKEMKRVLKKGGKLLILEFSKPQSKIVGLFHNFFITNLVPAISFFFAKNRYAYRYLPRTIKTFPCGREFLTLMEKAGFNEIRMNEYTLGTVTIYIGIKA